MGGTKIIVLQMKELIRTVIFALIGLILIIALVYFFLPKKDTDENASYNPGTYTSQVLLHNNTPIDIYVTVSDNEILDVKLSEIGEAEEVFYPLLKPTFEQLAEKVVKNQTLNINLEKESSVTSKVLLEAIKIALDKANIQNAL